MRPSMSNDTGVFKTWKTQTGLKKMQEAEINQSFQQICEMLEGRRIFMVNYLSCELHGCKLVVNSRCSFKNLKPLSDK
jgi:repressor of nif and glnA expression